MGPPVRLLALLRAVEARVRCELAGALPGRLDLHGRAGLICWIAGRSHIAFSGCGQLKPHRDFDGISLTILKHIPQSTNEAGMVFPVETRSTTFIGAVGPAPTD